MSHIVIDAREYSTSTGRYVSRMLHYLQQIEQGVSLDDSSGDRRYTVLLKPTDMDKAAISHPHFQKMACPFKEFTVAEQTGLLRQINSLQPDLVHFPMVQQPVRYRGRVVTTMQDLTTVRFRNPSKNPVIFTAKQQVYKLVNQIVARKSVHIITPTEFVKQDVVTYTHINPEKVTVTLEAADAITDEPVPVHGLFGARFIMYIGRPTPHKNLGRLIEAFAKLKTTQPDLKLVLAGKQDELYKRHAETVERRGIRDVLFTGFISDGQLRWLYENCQAYVFPSLSEGFGLPGLEAMTHGAPVVSSNATCLPEVYGDAAYYFDPLSADDMARAISDVIDNSALSQDLVRKGTAQTATYSWRRMAEQTLQIYKDACMH